MMDLCDNRAIDPDLVSQIHDESDIRGINIGHFISGENPVILSFKPHLGRNLDLRLCALEILLVDNPFHSRLKPNIGNRFGERPS